MAGSPYPASVRARPDVFVGAPGRQAAYYLVDQLIRSLLWGTDRERLGELRLSVETDGTLRVDRRWSGETVAFPGLGLEGTLAGSLAGEIFHRCVTGIGSQRWGRLDWVRGNPYTSIFVAVAVALSSRALLVLNSQGATLSQMYREGEPTEALRRDPGPEGAWLRLELLLDTGLVQGEAPAYPFKIRVPELACLLPGLRLGLQYKGFKPVEVCREAGMADLLDLYVPVEERIHELPFSFLFQEDGLDYRCSLFLTRSEMERIKSFAGLDESYYGGVHEDLLRRVVQDVFRRLHKLEIPVRRQSCDNVASSRMSYFGAFESTVPFRRESKKTEFVGTIPGLAAAIQLVHGHLEWETNYRARLVQPELHKNVRPHLLREFRGWVLDHPEPVQVWRRQWQPEKRGRRRKAAPAQEPAQE